MREIVNISLPPELNKQLEKMVKDGHYASKSEFIRHLLRIKKDQELAADIRQSKKEVASGRVYRLKSPDDMLKWK